MMEYKKEFFTPNQSGASKLKILSHLSSIYKSKIDLKRFFFLRKGSEYKLFRSFIENSFLRAHLLDVKKSSCNSNFSQINFYGKKSSLLWSFNQLFNTIRISFCKIIKFLERIGRKNEEFLLKM